MSQPLIIIIIITIIIIIIIIAVVIISWSYYSAQVFNSWENCVVGRQQVAKEHQNVSFSRPLHFQYFS